jgi:hypothetical protein
MNAEKIIISESNRPIWQIPIAALCFTIAFGFMAYKVFLWLTSDVPLDINSSDFHIAIYFSAIGVSFTYTKRIYIHLEESKFKPTFEVGPLKFGKWKTIKHYEYVSVFHQPLTDGSYIYEVNLWYDNNKHFQLYEKNDYKEAFLIGYELSEELDIDLLDATVPNDFKWIDKEAWKTKMNDSIET